MMTRAVMAGPSHGYTETRCAPFTLLMMSFPQSCSSVFQLSTEHYASSESSLFGRR